MAIPQLTIIGERINPGFKSSKALFDKEDIKGIQELAMKQVSNGAKYLNINAGERALHDADFMATIIRSVQEVVDVPLSFDFPNRSVQEVCLKTYDSEKAQGKAPIINSISELRWDMLELLNIRPCKIILMASEREDRGERKANTNSREVYETTKRMADKILNNSKYNLTLDDLFVDVSIGPIGADTEGITKMAIEAIQLIGTDAELQGIHMSVGLSNISVMLPKNALDGTLLKLQIESAFLTLAMPYGLDTVIGTPGRDYQLLPDDNFVMQGFKEAIDMGSFDAVMRIQELYKVA